MARQPRAGRNTGASQTGRLRIVAGKWRRRLLPVVNGEGLRPTSERIRETLFNWLAPSIDGARCLDVCAGTGALGFEALSRGAAATTFIEKSSDAVQALKNAAGGVETSAAAVHQADALQFLDRAPAVRYDIAFIDPPYTTDIQGELCRLLSSRGWLADDALVYLELARHKPIPALPDGWHAIRDKTAGNVRYLLLATCRPISKMKE